MRACLLLPSPLFRAGSVKTIADSFGRLPVQVGASVIVMEYLVHRDTLFWQFCWHLLARPATGQWTWQLRPSLSSLHFCLQRPPRHSRLQSPKHFCWHSLPSHSKPHTPPLHFCQQCFPLHFRSQVPWLQIWVQFPLLHVRLHVACSLLQVCSQFCPSHFRWQFLLALHICRHLQVCEHVESQRAPQLKVVVVWASHPSSIPLPEKKFNDFMKM